MQLTLAFGLKYDSDKSANLYSLSLGREHAVTTIKPSTTDLPGKPVTAQPATWAVRWYILTYNLHGLPVMQPHSAGIDLFI